MWVCHLCLWAGIRAHCHISKVNHKYERKSHRGHDLKITKQYKVLLCVIKSQPFDCYSVVCSVVETAIYLQITGLFSAKLA